MIETITYPAFYPGWRDAMTAITVAWEVFQER